MAKSPIYGFFIMPEWGVLGLEPYWQKSEKHVGINNVQDGGGGGLALFNGREKIHQ
jgi:hypothetical protein